MRGTLIYRDGRYYHSPYLYRQMGADAFEANRRDFKVLTEKQVDELNLGDWLPQSPGEWVDERDLKTSKRGSMLCMSKELSPETFDLLEEINKDPEVLRLRKEMTLYKKNDPGLAMMRSSLSNAVMRFNMDLGAALEQYKKFPSDRTLDKIIEKNWKSARVIDDYKEMFTDYCDAVIEAAMVGRVAKRSNQGC